MNLLPEDQRRLKTQCEFSQPSAWNPGVFETVRFCSEELLTTKQVYRVKEEATPVAGYLEVVASEEGFYFVGDEYFYNWS